MTTVPYVSGSWRFDNARPQGAEPSTAVPASFVDGCFSDASAAEHAENWHFTQAPFAANDSRGPGALPGRYAFAVVDERSGAVSIYRDITGTIPIFFSAVRGCVVWSSSLIEVVEKAGRKVPNIDFLIDYLCGARLAPHETPYDGIYQIPAGSALTADAHTWSVRRYWETTASADAKRSAGPREFRKAFEASIASAIDGAQPEEIAVRLSGGYDSTAVVAALIAAGIKPGALTVIFEAEGSDESAYVNYLEDALGLRVVRTFSSGVTVDDFETPPWSVSPFFDPYHREMGALYEQALANGWKVLLTGAFGDEFCQPFRPMQDSEAWLGGAILRRRFGFERPAGFLTQRANERFAHGLLRHWELPSGFDQSCLDVFLGWGASVQTDALYEVEVQYGMQMRHPFLDVHLFNLSCTMDDRLKTSDAGFKPILEAYLRDAGLPFIADRRGKASLGPYFEARYASYALSAIQSPPFVAAFNEFDLVAPETLHRRERDDAIDSRIHPDDTLRLWQVGTFLAEEF